MSEGSAGEKQKRIIIVEDNVLVAKFFRMALERAGGYSCMITEDVPTLLAQIESGTVALTSAEWEGQLVNGVELCQIFKQKSSRRLPVLLATAHAMSGDRERFLKTSGADGYLEKPVYDSAVLVAKVRELIEF